MSREEFAKWVSGTVLVASSLAIEQALDPDEPELTNNDIYHYTNTMRGYLQAIEEALKEENHEPRATEETT